MFNVRRLTVLVFSLFVVLVSRPTHVLAQNNPVPFVNQPLIPAAAVPGGSGFTLTVSGTGFVPGATVSWNGSARPTTVVSTTQLTAAIPATDIAAAGTARITVVNPAPGGGASNVVLFQVRNANTGVAFGASSTVTMAPAGSVITQWDMVGQPITADLNGDGKADLVTADFPVAGVGFIAVRLGNGDGTFQPIAQYSYDPSHVCSGGPGGLAVGDFNGDGKLDIVVTCTVTFNGTNTNMTAVLLGHGDGTFGAPVNSTQVFAGGLTAAVLQVADVNRDGKQDLVGRCQGALCVLLGNGDGTFNAGFTYNYGLTSSGQPSFALGDFNGDGKLDVVASHDPHYLFLHLGNGDGTFGAPTIIFASYSKGAGGVVAADFNGDGKLDVAYYHGECLNSGAGPCEGHLEFLFGNGDGTFQSPATLGGLSLPGNELAPIAGDFNGDGKIDLAFGNNLLLLGTGGPSPFSYSLLSLPVDSRQSNVAADFNGDGRLDLTGVPVPGPGAGPTTDLNLLLQTQPTADFSGNVTPGYQTIVNGNSATYTITVSSIDGFNGVVTPSVTGLPSGANASFNPPTVTGSGSTVLTVSTNASTPTGSFSLVVTLISGALSHGGGITLNVGPAGTDFTDFTGTLSATYSDVRPGGTAGYGVQIQPVNGFTGNVSFSTSGLPAGSTATFTPPTITGGSGSSNLAVTTAANTPTGHYEFILTATSGTHTHSTTLTVNVGPAGTNFGDITGSITPASQTVTAGNSAAVTISLQPLYGFTGSAQICNFVASPPDPGIQGRGNSIIPVPGSDTVTVLTSATTPPGTYTLTFTVCGGFNQHQGSVTLTVQ